MRLLLLALCLAITLALAACGGDEKTTTVTVATEGKASAAEDRAALIKLMEAYGAAAGPAACDFYSAGLLRELDGLSGCRRENADSKVVRLTVKDVSVTGNTGRVTVRVPGAQQLSVYPVTREGEPSDPYDGWKISDYSKDVSASGAPAGKQLSKAEFIAKGDALCAERLKAVEAAEQAYQAAGGTSLQALARSDESKLRATEKLVAEFEALEPPDGGGKALKEAFLASTRRFIASSQARIAAAKKGDLRAVGRANAGLQDQRRTGDMADYGFEECVIIEPRT